MIYVDEFLEVIKTLREGRIRSEELVTKRIALEELKAGLEEFTSPERPKMVVEF